MTVRDTSAEAYKEIVDTGLLGEMQILVFKHLYMNGPCTASELFYYMKQARRNPTHSNVATRLGELRDMGAVREVGKRECSITKRKVIEWEVTMEIPVKAKKLTKGEKKEKVLNALRELYGEESSGSKTKRAITRIAKLVKEI